MADSAFPPHRADIAPAPIQEQALQRSLINNRYYVRQEQGWAVQQELMSHDQAVYSLGEYTMFCLMWHLQDFEAGLVRRCPECFMGDDAVERAIASTYKQAERAQCRSCYGTTFEGGVRAKIIRPAIFTDTDQSERKTSRGVTETGEISIQSTTDFRVHTGDYAFRANGERYSLRTPRRVQLRTGFGTVSQADEAINYALSRAVLEDPKASTAYIIPPDAETLSSILSPTSTTPVMFSQYEEENGPLIPNYEGSGS